MIEAADETFKLSGPFLILYLGIVILKCNLFKIDLEIPFDSLPKINIPSFLIEDE